MLFITQHGPSGCPSQHAQVLIKDWSSALEISQFVQQDHDSLGMKNVHRKDLRFPILRNLNWDQKSKGTTQRLSAYVLEKEHHLGWYKYVQVQNVAAVGHGTFLAGFSGMCLFIFLGGVCGVKE